jgi:hypothetical protein
VPFGRPRLKAPRDRPPVDIPPLKRRRITYEVEEDEQEEPRLLLTDHGEDDRSGRRVRIRATFDDAKGEESEGDEEDADDDFIDEDSDEDEGDGAIEDDIGESDLEDELRELQEENQQSQRRGSTGPAVTRNRAQSSVSESPTRLDLETLDKISALRAAFPTVSADTCERALAQQQGSTKLAYLRLRAQHQPAMSLDAMLTHADTSAPKATATEDATADESEAESVASTVASMVKYYDQHGFPSGSILAGTAAAQMAEAMRKSGHPVKPPVHTKFDDDVEVAADQVPLPPSSDEEDSAGESESDGDVDSGPEVASSKIPQISGGARLSGSRSSSVSNDSESESEDESGDESSSEDDASTSDSDDGGDSDDDGSRDSDDSSSFDDDSDDSNGSSDREAGGSDSSASSEEAESSSEDESSVSSVDGASKARPVAGRDATTMQRSGPHGNLKLNQKPHLETIQPGIKSGPAETSRPVPPGQGKTSTQKRNARRRAAKRALKAAAEDDLMPPAAAPLAAAESLDLAESVATKKAALLQRLGMMQELISQEAGELASNDNDGGSAPSRAPAAENSALTDGIQPLAKLDSANGHLAQVGAKSTEQEDSEAWQKKITYRAVECCQEGIELSEPPFPFVQRWDPQQQYFHGDRNNRGGRSKRKQRNREEFVEEIGRTSTKRRKYGDSLGYDGDGESYANGTTGYEETTLNYDDEPLQTETQEQPEQTPGRNTDDEDDLPPLPADISALPTLEPGEAVAGMILTWKQLLLSKATNWQPQVSTLTGVVVDVLDEETLRVRLAKRDRNLDRNEKVYDDDGNRVYDNFEFPGMDDEDEEAAEQGYRTLTVADLIEPRVLRAASGTTEVAFSPKEPSAPEQQDAARDAIQNEEFASSNDRVSATPDEAEVGRKEVDTQEMDVDTQGDSGQGVIADTPFAQEPVDTSISEDRRHEISQLINDAGFRKDVDPSVTDIADNVALDLSSPSRQLEEMSYSAPMASSEAARSQSHASPELPSLTTSNNIDSQPILLEPFHGFSDSISDPHDGHDEPRVVYPSLDVPPSETGSLHSGRQVDPDFSIELGTRDESLHEVDDLAGVSRSTLGRHSDNEEAPVVKQSVHDGDSGSQSDSSASSFLSLSELWPPSASTNGSKKSPSKSAAMAAFKARKTDVAPDLEYEEAMRRLDSSGDISEEDDRVQLSELAQKLVDKPIEKPTPKKPSQKKGPLKLATAPDIKTERASPSPAPSVRTSSNRTVRASGSPPEGSQVISLLTSSPEPELEEHYAEDSIDETYEEPGLPSGSGWVRKERARRGVSMPAPTVQQDAAPKRLASSQSGKQSQDKRTSEALDSLMPARRKVLATMF